MLKHDLAIASELNLWIVPSWLPQGDDGTLQIEEEREHLGFHRIVAGCQVLARLVFDALPPQDEALAISVQGKEAREQ